MGLGRWQPSIVIAEQVLVTHTARVAIMEREVGHPPRMICAPDACYLFQTRDQARLSALMDRWESYRIAAQAVLVPPTSGP
jgi:hypothetical protein